MRLSEYIAQLEHLAEAGYYSQIHGGMPDADYVGYAYKRHPQTLGGKGFPYDRDRGNDQYQIGRDRGNAEHEPDHEPLTAIKQTKKSGFEEAAGTPTNFGMSGKGGSQTGNPAGGMGGGWANRPVKPWDEDDMDDETLSYYGEARGVVPVEKPAVLDQDPTPEEFSGEDSPHSDSDFDSFPSVLMQVAGSGFGTGLGATNPSGRGFMQGWTEDYDILAAESVWRQIASLLGLE